MEKKLLREVLPNAAAWCKGWFALDAEGHTVDATSPNAVKFCLIGAACRAFGVDEHGPMQQEIRSRLNKIVLVMDPPKLRQLRWHDAARYNNAQAEYGDEVKTTFDDMLPIIAEYDRLYPYGEPADKGEPCLLG